jgi:esterase/lipase superfamily enzyme
MSETIKKTVSTKNKSESKVSKKDEKKPKMEKEIVKKPKIEKEIVKKPKMEKEIPKIVDGKLLVFIKKFNYIKINFLDVFSLYKNFLHWNISKLIIFVWSTIVL